MRHCLALCVVTGLTIAGITPALAAPRAYTIRVSLNSAYAEQIRSRNRDTIAAHLEARVHHRDGRNDPYQAADWDGHCSLSACDRQWVSNHTYGLGNSIRVPLELTEGDSLDYWFAIVNSGSDTQNWEKVGSAVSGALALCPAVCTALGGVVFGTLYDTFANCDALVAGGYERRSSADIFSAADPLKVGYAGTYTQSGLSMCSSSKYSTEIWIEKTTASVPRLSTQMQAICPFQMCRLDEWHYESNTVNDAYLKTTIGAPPSGFPATAKYLVTLYEWDAKWNMEQEGSKADETSNLDFRAQDKVSVLTIPDTYHCYWPTCSEPLYYAERPVIYLHPGDTMTFNVGHRGRKNVLVQGVWVAGTLTQPNWSWDRGGTAPVVLQLDGKDKPIDSALPEFQFRTQ